MGNSISPYNGYSTSQTGNGFYKDGKKTGLWNRFDTFWINYVNGEEMGRFIFINDTAVINKRLKFQFRNKQYGQDLIYLILLGVT